MNAYLVNILLLTTYAFFIKLHKDRTYIKGSNRLSYLFCIFASLHWIILSGFRNFSIGSDTIAYGDDYAEVAVTGWDELINNFIGIYTGSIHGKDPGYGLFVKFSQIFFVDYQLYLILIAILFTIPLSFWIYKFSTDVYFSFLIYSTLFYAFFAITGHRQTIATALSVMIGFHYILRRESLKFFALIIISATIHKSSLIFFPFYYIFNAPLKRFHLYVYAVLWAIIFIFKAPISYFFKQTFGFEEYGIYEGAGTWSFTLLMITIGLTLIIKLETIVTHNKNSIIYINAYLISMLFTPLTFINPSAMRVVQYYSIFILLLIPEIFNSFKKEERVYIYTAATLVLMFFFIRSGSGGDYIFYWQN